MISFQDICFGVGVGIVGWMAVKLCRTDRQRTVAERIHFAFCVVFCFYGAVSVGVFEYFGRPLNYDLLRFIQGVSTIRSSVSERLTVSAVLMLLGAPAVFTLLTWWDWRRTAVPTWAIALAALVWIGLGSLEARPGPDDWKSYRQAAHSMALNPHVELAYSTLVGLAGTRPKFSQDFASADMDEFRTFAARGAEGSGMAKPVGFRAAERPRNVIVVTLESVGAKYLGLYGSQYPTTPNLEAEAAHAAVFENIYAHASQTICSFRAVNFSVYPGLPWCMAGWAPRDLAPALADSIRHDGWRTAYFHNGTLEWGGDRWMLDDNFDTVEDYTEWGFPPLSSWGVEDARTIERLIQWIDEEPGKPFLAYCWTDQTHDPYLPNADMQVMDFFHGSPPANHAHDLYRYLNTVREVDRQLGRLFAALRARGLENDTLVVITGDHGEAFADPHHQRGHGLTIYEEEIHVPLMIWNPRLFPKGQRIETVGAHVDLNPTIVDLLGISPRPEWQGHSLFDPQRPPRAFFMANVSSDYLFGMRESSWKYMLNATTGQELLFDLSRDRDEQENLAGAEPKRCRRFRQRVSAWVAFEDNYLNGRTE